MITQEDIKVIVDKVTSKNDNLISEGLGYWYNCNSEDFQLVTRFIYNELHERLGKWGQIGIGDVKEFVFNVDGLKMGIKTEKESKLIRNVVLYFEFEEEVEEYSMTGIDAYLLRRMGLFDWFYKIWDNFDKKHGIVETK